MATLQVKGLDDRLYEALRARASMDNRSISQEVAAIIRDYLSRSPQDARRANEAFAELIGAWVDNRSAEEITSDIRKARQSGTRFGVDANVFD
jgi:plasmid stability protein